MDGRGFLWVPFFFPKERYNLAGKKAAKTASFFPPSNIDCGKVILPLQPCSAKVLQGPRRKMGKGRCVPIGLLFLLRKNPLAATRCQNATAVNQRFAKKGRYLLYSSIFLNFYFPAPKALLKFKRISADLLGESLLRTKTKSHRTKASCGLSANCFWGNLQWWLRHCRCLPA